MNSLPPSETNATPIRFLALERDFHELADEYRQAQEAVLRSGQVVGGRPVEELERLVAAATERRHAIATTSGTEAIRLALVAAGVGPGWNVIFPALTYIATAGSVLATGARPIVVDVDEHAHLDVGQLADALSTCHGPTAVVPVGLFGDGLDDEPLVTVCAKYGAVVVEDAAQSLDSRHRRACGGGVGRAASISFAPTKTVPCFGNAGAVVTDDDEVAIRARLIRSHGKAGNRSKTTLLGANGTLSALLAAQLCVSFKHRKERARRRNAIAATYQARLAGIDGLTLPPMRSGTTHNWHKFVLRSDRRDALLEHMHTRGIEVQVHYPIPICDEPILAGCEFRSCDRSRSWSRTVCTLPLHPLLTDGEVDRIVSSVRAFHGC